MANWKALTLMSILIGFGGLVTVIVLYTATGGVIPFDYGVILDAGSSHTQVTLYHWLADKNRCTGVVEQISTCYIEGGISGFNDSQNVGESLLGCVNQVGRKIESAERLAKSSIYLGATAGMRLLEMTDPTKVELITTSIDKTFRTKTAFQVKTIEIISGADEGLFSWVTTNYLSDKLLVDHFDNKLDNSTYGMLDMGGASAQIAFSISPEERNSSRDNYDIRLYGINHTVRANSNLCFGVDQAMLRYLEYLIVNNRGDKTVQNPCQPKGDPIFISGQRFRDQICLQTKAKHDIDYDTNYTFVGQSDSEKCQNLVSNQILNRTICEQTYIKCFNVTKKPSSNTTNFYALSSYYYTVRVLGLPEKMSIAQYEDQMKQFCNSNTTDIKNRTYVDPRYADRYCFQLHYIYSTLKNVYNFDGDSWETLRFTNSIGQSSLGWSLGFMINATNAIPSEKPSPPVIELFPFLLIASFCAIILFFSVHFGIKWKRQIIENKKERYEPISIRT